jgi:pimeloyl-ACP methyl ester carboxylesterase
MNATSTVPVTVGALQAPGARLHYEVRGAGPLVVLVGAPMDAGAFAPLAELLAADHTVLTTDPRGIRSSPVDDPDQDSTPEVRADDLSRLIAHLDAGPAAVLGSSGGAVSALALAQAHPERVRTVVAHEPPLTELLPDAAEARALGEETIATYLSGDRVGAWRKFLANANIELPEPVFQRMFARRPDAQGLADEHFQFAHMARATTGFRPDLTTLRAGAPRIVVGIGEASAGQFCDRTARALADGLGTAPTPFPGGHVGFVEDPAAFAAALREVLVDE